jgi:hypothetical protein
MDRRGGTPIVLPLPTQERVDEETRRYREHLRAIKREAYRAREGITSHEEALSRIVAHALNALGEVPR